MCGAVTSAPEVYPVYPCYLVSFHVPCRGKDWNIVPSGGNRQNPEAEDKFRLLGDIVNDELWLIWTPDTPAQLL
jgi:hypothetical protein